MKSDMTRRDFVRTAATAAALAHLPLVHAGGRTDTTLRVGLIGCGGRGTGAVEDILAAADNVKIVALADLFPDRLESSRAYLRELNHEAIQIDDAHCFTGFDAYKKLLETDVNYVILTAPPGFRPLHFAAAIEAGKHVFMEKPVAVDPVGVRKIIEYGEQARKKGLGVLAGTQRRHDKAYNEVIKRIHDGQIGQILAGRAYWSTGGVWPPSEREPDASDMQYQIRNWIYYDWLSGDQPCEQHIHNLDVLNWVLQSPPVSAVGVGGRQVRIAPEFGNVFDHFSVDYEYPNGVHVLSMCKQQDNTAENVSEAVVGSKGHSDPASWIDGANPWKFESEAPNPYVVEHADMIASIRKGEPINEARQVAESTLTAILGREACYTGKLITWDEIMASTLDLSPAQYEFGPHAFRPVAMPGQSK